MTIRIIGIDPGLNYTGWGVLESLDNRLRYVGAGTIAPKSKWDMADRLSCIAYELDKVIGEYKPEEAVVEETFMNNNAASALKLGMARGVAMLIPAQAGISVAEYSATAIKKSVVGAGHASKDQVAMMVKTLLPTHTGDSEHSVDALAAAICHAHMRQTLARIPAA